MGHRIFILSKLIEFMGSLGVVIPGIILVVFGILFTFQGQGMVGPESSFMYQNEEWVDYGMIISMIGVILILIGYVIEKKRQI